jgi:hypothetical protein
VPVEAIHLGAPLVGKRRVGEAECLGVPFPATTCSAHVATSVR